MLKALKKAACVLLAAVMLVGLFGCASNSNHSPYSLSQTILSLCSDEIEWKSLSREQASAYYGLKSDLMENFAAYISDNDARYDAVAVFTFQNEEEKKELAVCYKEVLSSNKATASLVNENESNKITNSEILELDNMLILIAVENAQDVSAALLDLGAKKYVN